MQTAFPQLRPMGIIDQLDATLRLYRRYFVTFIGIVAVVQIPIVLVQTLYNVLVMAPLQQQQMSYVYSPDSFMTPEGASAYWNMLLSVCGAEIGLLAYSLLIVLPLTGLMMGAAAYAVSEAYLGRPPTLTGAFSYMREHGRWLRTAAANFLVGLAAVALAIIPCIGWIGSIYVYLRWALVTQAVTLEDLRAVDAMRRSWHLVQGHMLRLLGLAVLGWGVSIVLSFTMGAVLSSVFRINPFTGQTSYGLYYLVQSGVSAVAGVLYMPIFLGILTLFYYDLRVRKEGYDLRLRADQVAATVQPA